MPFVIPSLKIYVYSPNLTYDIRWLNRQKDYKQKNYNILTIDEFQRKYKFYEIIDEIAENIYLLKNKNIYVIRDRSTPIPAALGKSNLTINNYIRRHKHDWYKKYKQHNEHCVTDHNNNTFTSISEIAKYYNIPRHTLYQRLKQGYSIKDALTKPYKSLKRIVTDHKGKHYNSIAEMCKAYNIQQKSFYVRRNQLKWSLEDSLTIPPHSIKIKKDHNGNEYKNFTEMCRNYNINPQVVKRRLQDGKDIKTSLTTPVKNKAKIIIDPYGNTFTSLADLAKHYNKKPEQIYRLSSKGLTINEIIKYIENQCNNESKVQDHLGNTYASLQSMCKHYNITTNHYKSRKNLNWSLEKTLTTPIEKRHPILTDHKGNTYLSTKDMCAKYNISHKTFISRLSKGWSLDEALTIPIKKGNNQSLRLKNTGDKQK